MAMTAPRPRSRQPKQLDAGTFQAEITSFRLRLAAEDKSAKTIRIYTEAVQWFAAYLLEQANRDSWGQVNGQDIQRWMVWLLDRYSRLRFQDPQKFGCAEGYAAAGPGWMPRWRNRVAMSVRRCS